MFVLIIAVLMLIICAIGWAIAAGTGNFQIATKSRTGVLVSLAPRSSRVPGSHG